MLAWRPWQSMPFLRQDHFLEQWEAAKLMELQRC